MKLWAIAALFCALQARAVDTNAILNAWIASQSKLQTWSADFTQTRKVQTLKEPLRTPGRLVFAAPNRFRWELGQPAQTIAARGSNEMLVIYPRLKQAERYPLEGAGNEPWRDALALMDAGFAQSRADLAARFSLTSVSETNGFYRIALEPRSARARKFLSEVLLIARTNDFSMAANQMRFTDGTTLRNDFENAIANPKVEDGTFAPAIPPDFKIVEPAKR
jgi:outer membrane lipoprotein-sorting protein